MMNKLPSFNKPKLHLRRIEEKNKEVHETKLLKIESQLAGIQNNNQQDRKVDKKKLQLLEDRYTQIEKDNRLLLEKIMHIMSKKTESGSKDSRPRSLNISRRKRDQEDIIRENLQLLKRISQKKSDYSKDKIDRHWKQTEKYSDMLKFYYPNGGARQTKNGGMYRAKRADSLNPHGLHDYSETSQPQNEIQ